MFSLKSIMQWKPLIPQITSFIVGAIQKVEEKDIPAAQKELDVLNMTSNFLDSMPLSSEQASTVDEFMEAARGIISAQVIMCNILNIFKHDNTNLPIPPVPVIKEPTLAELKGTLVKFETHLAMVQANMSDPNKANKLKNTSKNIADTKAKIEELQSKLKSKPVKK
jgi:hypothetical protein